MKWADGLLSKKWSEVDGWTGVDIPQTFMTTKAPAVLKEI